MRLAPLLAASGVVALAVAGPARATSHTCEGRAATIVGSPGVGELNGTDGDDVIVTNGSTFVFGLGGNDTICVSGVAPVRATVVVDAGPGDDVVDATEALASSPKPLQIYGGPGSDLRYLAASVAGSWRDDAAAGTLTIDSSLRMTYSGFESYEFTQPLEAQLQFSGSNRAETLIAPARILRGVRMRGGPDLVALSDVTDLGAHLDGGSGADTVSVEELGSTGAIRVNLPASRLTSGRHGRARLEGFENVEATANQVTLVGDGFDNLLQAGGCGPAFVTGGGGDDRIDHDNLGCAPAHSPMHADGGPGNDVLVGGRGHDLLVGGPGHDRADGGPATDVCVEVEVRRSC
jgi:Ca2+-binding RTX toxin-like protein